MTPYYCCQKWYSITFENSRWVRKMPSNNQLLLSVSEEVVQITNKNFTIALNVCIFNLAIKVISNDIFCQVTPCHSLSLFLNKLISKNHSDIILKTRCVFLICWLLWGVGSDRRKYYFKYMLHIWISLFILWFT